MKFLRRFHLNNPLGNKGEDVAVSFLEKEGFVIFERNWKNKTGHALGEIDIVAKDGKEIVFVEVKAREASEREEVFPEENITREKLWRLSRIGEAYIRERCLGNVSYRFDAILIVFYPDAKPDIRHFRWIFL